MASGTPSISQGFWRDGVLLPGLALALACCVGAGGLLLARREVEVRRQRDRQAQRALGAAMQAEVLKLEELYERHLLQTGEMLAGWTRDDEVPRGVAQNVEGISRVSWLMWKKAAPERHLSIGIPPEKPSAEPTLEKEHPGLPRPRVLLEAARIFPDPAAMSHGWIDEPGKPLMFYTQVLGDAVVLTIERPTLELVMTRYLKQWLPEPFSALEKLGGPDLVQGARGEVLRAAAQPPGREPDDVATVVSRFAVWHIASWDVRDIQTSYHLPTAAGALALAVLVAGGGIGLGLQHRRAVRLARQRVSFVNRVSHELRTPMTNILLNLDVIEEAVPEAVSGRFSLVREEAGRLSRLIENVLAFSRQDEGCLKLQNTVARPVEIVNRVTRQFEPALERRGIGIVRSHAGTASEALLDADALAQVTANLLSNVEKYAPEAAVNVRTEERDGLFVLTVTDGGQGIPVHEAEHVFEPFFRLSDRVQSGVSGAGLGLSIARELAQRMGGSLKLVPSAQGACFELSLCLTPAPAS